MRKLALSLLILSSYTQANTLPNTANFYDENLQTHSEGTSFDVKQNGGSEYLNYHNILEVLKSNPYIYNPDFHIGVMDSGIYSNHEDFHGFYQGYLGGSQTSVPEHYHGNMVSSLFGQSQVADKIGIHGIVNAMVDFISRGEYGYSEVYEEFLTNLSQKPKVVNLSYTQHYCSSYRPYAEAKKGNYYCGLDKDSKYDSSVTSSHIRNFQDIRTEVLKHPDTLFVIAAGNRGVDALWEEGAIHYEVDEQGSLPLTPRKVDNVLIVGDIHNNGELKDYSNYGETVDIAAIGTAYAASTTSTDSTGNVKSFYDKYSGTSFSAPIVSGMASILFSMDPSLTPKEVKDLLTNSNKSTTTRRTGNLIFDKTEQTSLIPIADLSVSYHTLISRLKSHAILDSLKFNNKGENISNTNDCTIFWQQNNAERSVIGPKKVYESLFYGNKCLYFRGNSFIIEYDIPSKLAKSLYYGDAHYDEYQTVRKFINNMKSAKTDETWRQGYGVGLNSSGNVACLSADGSACTQPLNTPQQCENIWETLTGVTPNSVSLETFLADENTCFYVSNIGRDYNRQKNQLAFVKYNAGSTAGKIETSISVVNDFLSASIFLDSVRTQNQNFTGFITLANGNQLYLQNGQPYCSPEFDIYCGQSPFLHEMACKSILTAIGFDNPKSIRFEASSSSCDWTNFEHIITPSGIKTISHSFIIHYNVISYSYSNKYILTMLDLYENENLFHKIEW